MPAVACSRARAEPLAWVCRQLCRTQPSAAKARRDATSPTCEQNSPCEPSFRGNPVPPVCGCDGREESTGILIWSGEHGAKLNDENGYSKDCTCAKRLKCLQKTSDILTVVTAQFVHVDPNSLTKLSTESWLDYPEDSIVPLIRSAATRSNKCISLTTAIVQESTRKGRGAVINSITTRGFCRRDQN